MCDYSDIYILAKGTTTVPKTRTAAAPNNRAKIVVFKNYDPFTDYVSKINST